jgi:hypothetical protein
VNTPVASNVHQRKQKQREMRQPLPTYFKDCDMSDNNFNSNNLGTGANADTLLDIECQDVIAHMGDVVDGDLSSGLRTAIDAHLAVCAECREFHASYNLVVEGAAELRQQEKLLGVDVQNRLRKALNQRLGISLTYIA